MNNGEMGQEGREGRRKVRHFQGRCVQGEECVQCARECRSSRCVGTITNTQRNAKAAMQQSKTPTT